MKLNIFYDSRHSKLVLKTAKLKEAIKTEHGLLYAKDLMAALERLMKQAEGKYTGLCFVCHKPGFVADKRTQQAYGSTFPILVCEDHAVPALRRLKEG